MCVCVYCYANEGEQSPNQVRGVRSLKMWPYYLSVAPLIYCAIVLKSHYHTT